MATSGSREETARALLERVWGHLEALRSLWEPGAIEVNTTDASLNGYCANVNAELESEIRAFLAPEPEASEEPKLSPAQAKATATGVGDPRVCGCIWYEPGLCIMDPCHCKFHHQRVAR